MGDKTCRPGALLHFMTKGLQEWHVLDDPYDEVLFPNDDKVEPGMPNVSSYPFVTGAEQTVNEIMARIDPENKELKKRALLYMDLCKDVNAGFTALGLSRMLPSFLHFLLQKRVDRLMKIASMTVRDVQYAMFNLGMTADQLLNDGCPRAPEGPEPDPVIRRLKAVLTHPIGDYAVQPREATMVCSVTPVASHQALTLTFLSYAFRPPMELLWRTTWMVLAIPLVPPKTFPSEAPAW